MLEATKQLMHYFSKVAAEKFLKEKQAGLEGKNYPGFNENQTKTTN